MDLHRPQPGAFWWLIGLNILTRGLALDVLVIVGSRRKQMDAGSRSKKALTKIRADTYKYGHILYGTYVILTSCYMSDTDMSVSHTYRDVFCRICTYMCTYSVRICAYFYAYTSKYTRLYDKNTCTIRINRFTDVSETLHVWNTPGKGIFLRRLCSPSH